MTTCCTGGYYPNANAHTNIITKRGAHRAGDQCLLKITFMFYQAGFNAGDGINYYEIEGAGTDSVINLTRTSNVCIPGRWIFRVDSREITSGKSVVC